MRVRARGTTAAFATLITSSALAWSLAGCGGVQYATAATVATSRLEEARQLGAEKLAPYEYYYAKEHLEQAEVEAYEASYSDASDYAETAEKFAIKAAEKARALKSEGAAAKPREEDVP